MSSSSDGSWSTKAYTQKLSFVCEKPVGGKKIVTIEVHKFTKKSRKREFNMYTTGRIMEGIFRSLNIDSNIF